MSPFGLFDLLKTLLPSPDQTAQAPATPSENMQTEPSANPPQNTLPELPDSPQNPPLKPNACADFLYRHEQRARGIKETKKRLD